MNPYFVDLWLPSAPHTRTAPYPRLMVRPAFRLGASDSPARPLATPPVTVALSIGRVVLVAGTRRLHRGQIAARKSDELAASARTMHLGTPGQPARRKGRTASLQKDSRTCAVAM